MASRILCVDDGLQLWGAQRVLLQVAPVVRDAGVELVLGAPPDSALMEHWAAAEMPCVPIDLPRLPSPRSADGQIHWRAVGQMVLSSPIAISRIRRAARESGVQAMLANSHPTQLDTAIAGRLSGLPVTLYLHEELPYRLGRLLREVAVRVAGQTVAVSTAVQDQLAGDPRPGTVVVPNGVDTELFSPGPADHDVRKSLGAEPDDLLILAVTRLDPVKRIDDIIQATATLPRDLPWHLCLVGETTAFPDYVDGLVIRARHALGDRVTFAGRRGDMPDIMRAADLVVHSGVVEGLPLSLLEAQSCGKPVVAYRVAGIGDAVLDGGTGVLAGAGDVIELARGLLRLALDPDLRLRFGEAAAERCRPAFDFRAQAQQLASVWRLL